MNLPKDDFILLSLVNTKLRDGDGLQDFCAQYGAEREEVITRLAAIGYGFDERTNAFKRII